MKKAQINKIAYTFLLVPLAINLVFRVVPLVSTVFLSFSEWNIVRRPSFVGLKNYTSMFADEVFKMSVGSTVVFSVTVTLFSVVIALMLALLLNESWFPGRVTFRVIFFIPAVCSMVAISIIWMWLYDPEYGLINYLLNVLGVESRRWLSDTRLALPSLVIMTVWANIGFNMVIYLAGLQGIPEQLMESSLIDGAGRARQIWSIVLPMLKPTTFFVVATQFVRSFKIFGPIHVLTQGGPVNRTNLLVYYLFQNGFQWFKMGYASAISIVLLAMIIIVTLVQDKLFKTDY